MVSAAERAYAAIRSRILSGETGEGTPLREALLASELGVSRTPVREALRRLDAEGLVTLEVNRGAHVRSWPPEALDEIFGLRALIEGRGARLAAAVHDGDAVPDLHVAAEEMLTLATRGKARDLDRIADLNNAFHRSVLELSRSPYLQELREELIQLPLIRRTFHQYSPSALDRSLRHHVELADAIAVGDPDWAEAVMRSHILAARHALEERRGDG